MKAEATSYGVTAADKPLGCPYCGMIHATTCWRVKAIEYHPDGSIKRVELRDVLMSQQ